MEEEVKRLSMENDVAMWIRTKGYELTRQEQLSYGIVKVYNTSMSPEYDSDDYDLRRFMGNLCADNGRVAIGDVAFRDVPGGSMPVKITSVILFKDLHHSYLFVLRFWNWYKDLPMSLQIMN